jgi:2-polyprenyl-3-methyl-5-hydroxy-6-metoxy-1,4-benzoquinol methylase
MSAIVVEYSGPSGTMHVEALPDGRHRVSVNPARGQKIPRPVCVTNYPLDLIREIHDAKDLYVCDEIMREENPVYVEHLLRREVLSYLEPATFANTRILDFGCGSGASMLVMSRLLPPCEIVGVELEEKLLHIARQRARHFGRSQLRFLRSPSAETLPPDLGLFDFIMFSAVFEHLLPHERPVLLRKAWEHLKPGGTLFLNQTPYRYSPVEIHTTGGMPFLNYLSDRLTLAFLRRFSSLVSPDEDWTALLRRGIRGATVPEILRILGGPSCATLLEPLPRVGDRIDLWYSTLSPNHAFVKRGIRASLKALRLLTGAVITPQLSLAIRKNKPDSLRP